MGEASVREFECGGRLPSQEKLLPIRQLSCAAGVLFFGQDSYCQPVVRLQEPAQFPVTNLSDREAGIICIRECTRSYLDRNAKVRGQISASPLSEERPACRRAFSSRCGRAPLTCPGQEHRGRSSAGTCCRLQACTGENIRRGIACGGRSRD
ncbi:hypothetical protein MPLDJ20_310028 [Mesorhizobium plurifarium]|uniref:Uncharacterized protein n=1 Tax=Mesorhizobium plurifarium TaxID=69974 RepID=A0A090GNM8_MESPL|nr:hypothetical protein MPLDJ20_310028 [Mesorhizobium plurifarium]